jgi:hypothetical protein
MSRMAKVSDAGTARSLLFVVIAILMGSKITAQDCQAPFTTLKQKKVANINIPGNPIIHGYLEHLPDDYNSTTKKYPVLIYIHGVNEVGSGSSQDLCKLLFEWNWEPPVQVELGKFPYSVKDQNGTTHKYILISPQLGWFSDASNTINTLIAYLMSRYRIDPGRIYLTGVSAGADLVNSYISNEADARKVAAVFPVAQCSTIQPASGANAARAGVRYWALKCGSDGCGGFESAENSVNNINALNPSANLAWNTKFPTAYPQPEWPCANPAHNQWGIAYDTLFKQYVYGRLVNVYEWAVQFTRTASGPLPITLKDFTARLSDGKVYLRWTTEAETNSKRFGIERAGASQQFTELAALPAAGSSATDRTYEWVDNNPLPNLNFYRLTQTDADGQKEYFPIRKILNRGKWDRAVIVSPNPFASDLSVYLHVEKAQRVQISLNDLSGKRLHIVYGMYKEGAAEVNIPAGKLPRGVYILKVEGESFSETQKVMKQ